MTANGDSDTEILFVFSRDTYKLVYWQLPSWLIIQDGRRLWEHLNVCYAYS